MCTSRLVDRELLNETLGKGWICHSFLANGAEKGYYPQVLHLDQSPLSPWITEEAPALVNTLLHTSRCKRGKWRYFDNSR